MNKSLMQKLDYNKFKINGSGGKGLIRMELFLSFLTVPVIRSNDHLGASTDWTKLTGEDELIISGGVLGVRASGSVERVEFLDSIKYKKKLHNNYNNWVTPFHIWEILNLEGKAFFSKYYKDDINAEIKKAENAVNRATLELKSIKKDLSSLKCEAMSIAV